MRFEHEIFNFCSFTKECELFAGTFSPYEPLKAANAPEILGFAGGVYFGDNSTEYIGYGSYPAGSVCNGQSPSPGFILTKSSAPGAYIPCNNANEIDSTTAFYINNHPLLKWVPSGSIATVSSQGLIKINGSAGTSMFGRVLFEGRYYVGKVEVNNNLMTLWFVTSDGEKGFRSGFDILTCGK